MSYFRELPNIFYQSQSKYRNSSNDYVLIKNIFRRTKLRDDLQNVVTLFNKYQIAPGERPDTIAGRRFQGLGRDVTQALHAEKHPLFGLLLLE